MRHQVAGRKLGRKSAHRKAMFQNMVASLIKYGRIRTTLHKAKELRPIADKMVSIGKENSLHARRRAFDFMRNRDAVVRLFEVIAPAFAGRKGGYTRIYHADVRPGDAAPMALVEYLAEDIEKIEPKVAKGDAKAKPAKAKKGVAEKVKKPAKAKAEKPVKKDAATKPKKAKAKKDA